MDIFNKTTHLSEILEMSDKGPVIIFKHSESCLPSSHVYVDLEQRIIKKEITYPVYLVIVETEPVLSQKITDNFSIKHETPQIIILNKREVVFVQNHTAIDPEKFQYEN